MTGVLAMLTISCLLKLGNNYVLHRYWPEQMRQSRRAPAPQPLAKRQQIFPNLQPMQRSFIRTTEPTP